MKVILELIFMFAINGFGRIGRSILKAYFEGKYYEHIRLAVINCGIGTLEEHVHLLKYDSVHGKFLDVKILDSNTLLIRGKKIKCIFQPNPKEINWQEFGVKTVVESTGKFTNRTDAALHIESGAKNVLLSAPAKDSVDATIVYGVNSTLLGGLKDSGNIISAGSCTTNCLAPILQALIDGGFSIESGFMTTIHAYTNDQNLVDSNHTDKRRARAAAVSMIPSSTGAAKAIGLVVPQLNGLLDGVAVRVPVANVSLIDLKLVVKESTSVEEINSTIKSAAAKISNVLKYEEEELVSIDFNHSSYSSVYDATQTKVVRGKLVRIAAWYDNEWGFSNRILDILKILEK